MTALKLAAATVLGSTTPRLLTPPLVTGAPAGCGCGCPLTPESSYGFAVESFARNVLGVPLDPWQRWLVIHAGELLEDGRPRFRRVVVLVGRQAGKTFLLTLLSLYWLYVEGPLTLLGTSTKTSTAKEPWQRAIDLARSVPDLAAEIPARGGIRRAAGEEELTLTSGSRYKVAASNAEGGRGLSLDRVIADELRQHHDYSAYGASYHAMRARRYAQFWALSSAGDDRSIVLNDLRASALTFIESGAGDYRLGLFEWSAPDDADPLDAEALAMANPTVGYPDRVDLDDLLGEARQAVAKGGAALTDFRTESMNQRVLLLDPAVDPGAWLRCLDPGDLAGARSRLALCLDVSPDGTHATLAAAAVLDDERVRVETVAAWEGPGCTDRLRRELPGWLDRLKAQTLGWFPSGPAAELAADLTDRRKDGVRSWVPRGVSVSEIRGETTAVVMGFAADVAAFRVAHSGQALLDAHIGAAERLRQGDAWRFRRSGAGNVDAAYAVAGAAYLARTMPPRRKAARLRIVDE